jgi:amino acid adenylation domain-containing protein
MFETSLDLMGDGLRAGFLGSAGRRPEAWAVRNGERCWSYAEAEETARRWAGLLGEACGGAPQRVGVFAARGAAHSLGVLASLFAGAAFVPLNRALPRQRTRLMIELADLDALLVDAASLPQLAAVLDGLPRPPAVLLPESTRTQAPPVGARVLDREDLRRAAPLRTLPAVRLDATAYLLFTSGSTGNPKGVPISHANIVHFLAFNQRRYGLGPEDRLTQIFEPTFDLSVFDLFMAWGAGACSCVVPPLALLAPFRLLREQGITVWFSVPSVGALLRKKDLLTPGSMPGLRWSLFCGEPLPRATAAAWQDAAYNSVVENLYGPTELTVACSCYRWNPERSPGECANDIVPIGRLYDGLEALVMGEDLEEVPPGEVGELCVAGPQTFAGYWRDPERTAASFITRPDGRGRPVRYYRTGDRVHLAPRVGFSHRGRVDFQVKVLGHRVELGEIEAALRRQPGVIEAAALGWPVQDGTAEGIVAFVSGRDPDPDTLIAALRDRLPGYMVPRTVHVLDALPLNDNGKIDRKTLTRHLALLD